MEQSRKIKLSCKGLGKTFKTPKGDFEVLRDLTFDVYENEFLVIFGPGQCGKTTLLNMLAGLEAPSRGAIQIAGKRIDRMSEAELVSFRRQNVGFIFQSYNLIGSMNALENVAMPLMFRGVPYEKRIREAEKYMKLIGIGDQGEHMPNQMSGGQQQRVGIARALVIDPKIIFADEPTGNLDSHTTEDVLSLLRKIVREEDRTLIMVTHDAHIASWADRQLRVVDGKIVETVIRPDSPIEQKIETETGNPPFAQVTPLG